MRRPSGRLRQTATVAVSVRRWDVRLHEHQADQGWVELHAQAEVGLRRRGFEDLAHDRQINRREQVICGVVLIAIRSEQDLLAALGIHALGPGGSFAPTRTVSPSNKLLSNRQSRSHASAYGRSAACDTIALGMRSRD
jgi:hypothetical protein